jgi:DNA-binding response OmpR family regulator
MPVIFLTSKSLKIDKLKGFKLGADDYIVKPVDEEELIARIQAVMRRAKPQQQIPEITIFSI